jgi:hypothetical protein
VKDDEAIKAKRIEHIRQYSIHTEKTFWDAELMALRRAGLDITQEEMLAQYDRWLTENCRIAVKS